MLRWQIQPLFSIRGYADDFYTGGTGDKRQVLLGLIAPCLVAYFFSQDGRLLGREARPWRYPAPDAEGERYKIYEGYNVCDQRFQIHLGEQMRGWMKEMGFIAGPIQVEAFRDEEFSVEVYDGEDAGIILHWAKEYSLSPEGEVMSTWTGAASHLLAP